MSGEKLICQFEASCSQCGKSISIEAPQKVVDACTKIWMKYHGQCIDANTQQQRQSH